MPVGMRLHERLRRWRGPATALALVLALAQIALAAHALKHFVASPDEQHHCPACRLADHVPVLTAAPPTLPATAAGAETPPAAVATAPSSFSIVVLPRGPPA